MLGMELMDCQGLAVPHEVMQHVVRVESSFNPYAIGVVGGRLARQPRTLPEAVATAQMLERRGYNFSVGLAQLNRYNLARQGLATYEQAFQRCPNLQAGSRILAECHGRSGGSWGRAFSCYYSGNFTTGYRHGYVQKVFASMRAAPGAAAGETLAIDVVPAVPRTASTVRPGLSASRPTLASRPPSARIAARSEPVAARIPPAAAQAPTPADVASAPIDPGTTHALADGRMVAVLNADGGAPQLVPQVANPPPTTTVRTPAAAPPDSAFVF